MEITIAMPAYNEEESIEEVVGQALAILDGIRTEGEVLVLDDCSTDRTREILARLSAKDKRLRVILNERNQGVAGFEKKLVLEAKGEWLFMGSSDGETDYSDVPRFLELAKKEKLQAVFGYRQVKHYAAYRAFISWSYNFLVRNCFGVRFKDAGWVKLIHCPTFAPIPLYSQSAFASAERLLAGRKMGAKYAEVGTKHLNRLGGRASGGRLKWVIASFRDLLFTRLRFFLFNSYYRKKR